MRSSLASILLGIAIAPGLLATSCTEDGDGTVTSGACQTVIEACHEKDDGSDDMINGCHSRAHEGDDAVCSADLQACLDACDAAPPVGGTGSYESSGTQGGQESDGSATVGQDGSTGSTGGLPGTTSVGSTSSGSSTGADDSSEASCDELGTICHDAADEFGMMCHDVGHDGDEAACAAIWVECIEHCA